MFWDKVSGVYDLFENIYNKCVYQSTGETVAKYIKNTDRVLECACGTGAISIYIAPKCNKLFASDYSVGMLKQAKKKLKSFDNVEFKKVDITNIKSKDDSFDVVVAGNVIHLLPDPQSAMKELTRVCKDGGKLIIPTYINGDEGTNKLAVKFLEKLGASFKRQFDSESYEKFFAEMGYEDVAYEVVRGRMSCSIAIIGVKRIFKFRFCVERIYFKMIIETERLILRKWMPEDAESLFVYAKNPNIGPIAGWPPHKDIEESKSVIDNVFNGSECYAICEKENNVAIGAVELKLNGHTDMTERDDECELGYWLGEPFWGRGYMPEAANALLKRGFEKLGMTTIWCGYYDGNEKSKRVQEKLGFTYHHTCDEVPVPLLNEVRVGHTNIMTREQWESR